MSPPGEGTTLTWLNPNFRFSRRAKGKPLSQCERAVLQNVADAC